MPAIQMDRLLDTSVKQGASDVHLTVGKPPVLRLKGRMRELKTAALTPEDTASLMKQITPEKAQQELQEVGSTDFGFSFKDGVRFRVAVFKQRNHLALVLRQIPNSLLTVEQLGLPRLVSALCRRPRGLFLVTGPTGSGKSTSLAGMVNFINETMDHHIITIEDPIEYYHEHKKSIINQREVGAGKDCSSFSDGLRRALRQDPDVILVGEMRDLETIEAAIGAAETGHLVFGTLHTNSAAGTINRIIDAFPTNQQEQIRVQLSTSLLAVLSQTLLPRIDNGKVVAAYEFMVVTPAIANLIRDGKTFRIDSAIQTGKKQGMQLLDDHLYKLWAEGKVSPDDILDKCRDPQGLAKRLQEAGEHVRRAELEEDEENLEMLD